MEIKSSFKINFLQYLVKHVMEETLLQIIWNVPKCKLVIGLFLVEWDLIP